MQTGETVYRFKICDSVSHLSVSLTAHLSVCLSVCLSAVPAVCPPSGRGSPVCEEDDEDQGEEQRAAGGRSQKDDRRRTEDQRLLRRGGETRARSGSRLLWFRSGNLGVVSLTS